jgi:hypothetical protein
VASRLKRVSTPAHTALGLLPQRRMRSNDRSRRRERKASKSVRELCFLPTTGARADFPVELRGFEPRCSWRCLRVTAASARLSFESRLELEAFAIRERQSDAVAEGIEKVVLAVTGSVANTKALDLVEQVIS